MGYLFNVEDAQHYYDWYRSEPGLSVALVQKKLLLQLWSPVSAQRVLEVCCGPGIFLEWFAQQGHHVTGVDPSPHMLKLAQLRLPSRASLDHGYAEDLPYDDNSFDTVAMISAMEFVDDPYKALREAIRVARRHVLLGALNKYSLITCQRYLERLWKPSVFTSARFFSVFELRHMVEKALSGPIPLTWRTCLTLPLGALRYLRFLESSRYFHYHPFGHFIAMRVDLCYPLQTVQDPLFTEIGSGMSHARLHASCWRSPHRRTFRSRTVRKKELMEGGRSDKSGIHVPL